MAGKKNPKLKTPRYSVDRSTSYKGERHWAAVIKEDDVRLIKQLLNEDVSQADIARKFGVGRHVICDIANERSWRHVV